MSDNELKVGRIKFLETTGASEIGNMSASKVVIVGGPRGGGKMFDERDAMLAELSRLRTENETLRNWVWDGLKNPMRAELFKTGWVTSEKAEKKENARLTAEVEALREANEKLQAASMKLRNHVHSFSVGTYKYLTRWQRELKIIIGEYDLAAPSPTPTQEPKS